MIRYDMLRYDITATNMRLLITIIKVYCINNNFFLFSSFRSFSADSVSVSPPEMMLYSYFQNTCKNYSMQSRVFVCPLNVVPNLLR